MTAINWRIFSKIRKLREHNLEEKKRFWYNLKKKVAGLRVGFVQSQRNLILQDNTLFNFDSFFRNELIFADWAFLWKSQDSSKIDSIVDRTIENILGLKQFELWWFSSRFTQLRGCCTLIRVFGYRSFRTEQSEHRTPIFSITPNSKQFG